ncbi:hypothetical protein EDD16DRAFT_1523149 [Pisolithus croceorrhizus]|nr:hypothetical protein EDD16DRAFT_1523149 [Pisolithus croceorrhizus]
MSLSSVPSTLDNATHVVLDEKVNQHAGPYVVDSPLSYYISLLQTIMQSSNGTLDPTYNSFCAVHALLATQPALVAMLDATRKSESYRDIRNLGRLLTKSLLTSLQRMASP